MTRIYYSHPQNYPWLSSWHEYSEKEIAEKLNLSYHTVNNHLRNIRERHNIQKNTEIIILYAASLSKKKVSFKEVKEFGLSILFVALNVCDYTQINV